MLCELIDRAVLRKARAVLSLLILITCSRRTLMFFGPEGGTGASVCHCVIL